MTAGKTGSKKWGRNKAKCLIYKSNHIREKNKVRRVLKASGVAEARTYAKERGVVSYLETILKRRTNG